MLKNILIFLLKQKIFIPIMVLYSLLKIKELKKVNKKKKNKNILTILVLNSIRWQKDIEILNNDDRIRILIFPTQLHNTFGRLFFGSLQGKILNGTWWEGEHKKEFEKLNNRYVNYLIHFLPALKFFKKFDVISTCTFYYLRDKPWQEACDQISCVKYIALHKENQKDDSIMDSSIKEYKKKKISYKRSYIFVYNRKEKGCIEKSLSCDPKRIIIVGCMRMDNLIKKAKEYKFDKRNNAITLFSFRHTFGGMRFFHDGEGGFSISRKNGCVNYFDNVHGNLAKYAIENPEVPVYIKLKWENAGWFENVANAVNKKTGKFINEIPNLYVSSHFNPQELIDKSRVIIGINSTALIESRILGKEVLIPLFDEPLEKYYEKHVYFKKYFKREFNLIKDEDHFLKDLDYLYKNTGSLRKVGKELVEEFLGFFDSKSKDRVIKKIIEISNL